MSLFGDICHVGEAQELALIALQHQLLRQQYILEGYLPVFRLQAEEDSAGLCISYQAHVEGMSPGDAIHVPFTAVHVEAPLALELPPLLWIEVRMEQLSGALLRPLELRGREHAGRRFHSSRPPSVGSA